MLGEYYKTPTLKNFTSNNFCQKYVEQFAQTANLKKEKEKIKEKEYIPIIFFFPADDKIYIKDLKRAYQKENNTKRKCTKSLYQTNGSWPVKDNHVNGRKFSDYLEVITQKKIQV